MPVALRLMRFGKKGYPTYRVVALDKRSKRDGAYIEKVGLYNPMTEPATLDLNEERLNYWLTNGAAVSEGMQKLLKRREKKVAAPKAKKTVKTAKAAAK
jgi:small subunit ribosomal protein S16